MLKTQMSSPVVHGSAQAIAARNGALHTATSLDLSRYLLSQCTIVCSVAPEKIVGPDGEYNIIHQACNHLVNQNGDSWLNQVLLESYPTFRGAFNFVEHNQVLSENKGRILDAVARKVTLVKPDPEAYAEVEEVSPTGGISINNFLETLQPRFPTPKPKTPKKIHTNQSQFILGPTGEPLFIYYIDILVATALQFTSLIEEVLDGSFNAMSMGCVVTGSTCSYCGHEVREPYPSFCQCLLNERGTLKLHPQANRLVAVSELCGIPGEIDTNQFIEASWVKDPAFIGARKAFIIDLPAGFKKTAYFIPQNPAINNISKAASIKSAAAHDGVVVDMQTMRNTAQSLARNPMLRSQINRYLNLYGFSIEPMNNGRSSYPTQRNDTQEFKRTQDMFKRLGLR